MSRRLALSVTAILAACGAAGSPLAVEETSDLLAAGGSAAIEDAPAEPGTIRRTDLDGLLAAGPGALLARVETAPERRGGRFIGFRIAGFPKGPPRTIDLRPGDVVQKVNGRDIERPEQYFEAFRALAGAAEIRFEILRDGVPMLLTYPVVD